MYHHWSYISSHSNLRICWHSSFCTDNMNSCLRFDYLGPRKEIGLTSAEKRPIYIPHQGWQVHFPASNYFLCHQTWKKYWSCSSTYPLAKFANFHKKKLLLCSTWPSSYPWSMRQPLQKETQRGKFAKLIKQLYFYLAVWNYGRFLQVNQKKLYSIAAWPLTRVPGNFYLAVKGPQRL